jgi:malonate-semialdehyde dehydrogenase (acetylating) / methylmalonate-semialdehyde dehydrogenase
MDITGDGGMEFFTNRIKISSKWPIVRPVDLHLKGNEPTDHANFAGTM